MNKTQKVALLGKILPTTIVGNALEFYDFMIYAIFASTIGKLFFPLGNETASLIASWGTFAVGFLMRPLGAVVFGTMGDKLGRKYTLGFTILLTGLPTLTIGLLPGYHAIGLWAPAILIICRLMQGLCTGGEYNGAVIFALEHFGKMKPGAIGGAITGSCVIGALLATFAGFLVSVHGEEWMWRIPFIAGALISFLGFIIRQYMAETPEFMALLPQDRVQKHSTLPGIFTRYPSSCFRAFCVGALNGALSYTLFGFLNVYLSKYLGVESALAMKYNLLGLVCYMIGAPIAGYILDLRGRTVTMLWAAVFVMVTIIPVFYCLQKLDPSLILLAQALLGLGVAGIAGAGHGYMQGLFPTHLRYRGISINFCLGMAVCGGTVPMVLTFLIEVVGANLYAPAFYLMGLSAIFFFALRILDEKEDQTSASHYAEPALRAHI